MSKAARPGRDQKQNLHDTIPRNVHPECDECSHKARAKALAFLHAGYVGGRYVDSANYASRRGFAVVVITSGGSIRPAASTTSGTPEKAEEVAIALAIKGPDCSTIPSDWLQAMRNFALGGVSAPATKILNRTPTNLERVRIK